MKTQGLRFGLHNHWWEFEETDGIYPFYYLLEHLDEHDKDIFDGIAKSYTFLTKEGLAQGKV